MDTITATTGKSNPISPSATKSCHCDARCVYSTVRLRGASWIVWYYDGIYEQWGRKEKVHASEQQRHRRGWVVWLCGSAGKFMSIHSWTAQCCNLTGRWHKQLTVAGLQSGATAQCTTPAANRFTFYTEQERTEASHTEDVATHQCLSWLLAGSLLANCLRLLASTECASVCREAALPDSARCVPPLTLPASLSLLFLH